jgi:hypothetical protein
MHIGHYKIGRHIGHATYTNRMSKLPTNLMADVPTTKSGEGGKERGRVTSEASSGGRWAVVSWMVADLDGSWVVQYGAGESYRLADGCGEAVVSIQHYHHLELGVVHG